MWHRSVAQEENKAIAYGGSESITVSPITFSSIEGKKPQPDLIASLAMMCLPYVWSHLISDALVRTVFIVWI